MTDTSPKEPLTTYLPEGKIGKVESFLERKADSMVAPICSTEEIDDDLVLRIWANFTDVCIRNITFRFEDGPTYFCLVSAEIPNALIVKFDDFQCVVISKVLPEANFGLALKMLNSTSYWNYLETGNPSVDPSRPPSKSRDNALKSLFALNMSHKTQFNPATLFLIISAYFLCSHELGHLALGHLDRNDGNEASIIEIGAVTDDQKLESRAREWDADIFASAATLWHLGSLAGEEGWKEFLQPYPKSLRYFIAAIYHFFTVFDFSSPHSRAQNNLTHPEPMVRAGIIVPAIASIVSHWGRDEDIMEVSKSTIREFEIALFELTDGNMDREEAMRLQAKAELDLQEIGEAFQKILPSLDRTRLADLAFAKNLQ